MMNRLFALAILFAGGIWRRISRQAGERSSLAARLAWRLLAEADHPRGRSFPAIDAWTLHDVEVPVLRYLQAQWREHLGIEITWQMFEWNALIERRVTHTPHLFTSEWFADYPDPDSFLRVGLHQKHTYWHNEQYEQLLDSARRINDPVERLKFYQAADRLLVQEAGIMPLYHDRWLFLIKPWVKRYPTSAVSAEYWKDVIIEAH